MTEAAPDLPGERRWRRLGLLLAVVMIGATAGILAIVVRNSVLLGRMTTDVAVAQQRATTLHGMQTALLHLRVELADVEHGAPVADAEIQRGLFNRMAATGQGLFPAGSAQAGEIAGIRAAVDRFPWARLERGATPEASLLAAAETMVSQVEVRVQGLYNEQEQVYYTAIERSLKAKRDSQYALGVLVSLVGILSVCWLLVLRRRQGRRLASAYAALLTEVDERRALQDQLSHQAYHDVLTGLPNRALFVQRLEEQMADPGEPPAVLLVDLDGFKTVNDTLGHPAGDELLELVAERLRGCVRGGDTVARLGGDEFAVVVRSSAPGVAEAISRRLIAALREPFLIAGQEVGIGASVGIAHRADQAGANDLLADADIAMYVAKGSGKARFEVFRRDMRDRARRRAQLEQQLARAVDLGEIEVYYQPIVRVTTGRVVAVEALARWRHPVQGLISPAEFIPIAEESGLIREVGREVLRQATRQVQQWRETLPGLERLEVSVNVSVRQLAAGIYAEHVREALADSGMPAEATCVEITETMALEGNETVAAELDRIREQGVALAMDDFGSGYSSVSSLVSLQVQVVKIDKSYLDMDSANNGTLIRATTELGHALGLRVCVEGVETPEQLELLREAGCDSAQGFLLGRPMPADAAREHLLQEARQMVG
ncbi:putative bifunctional diguanylate cyclase/phosphodiesterase [Actinoplanes sp. NPDC049265]|uniref:putative bifunctional diguanylate cyclase/phosphodiesterase n=1 Tax=Actinoplanes sp. NPDC049265 TaxID=3363902 RepID=UPI0037106B8B